MWEGEASVDGMGWREGERGEGYCVVLFLSTLRNEAQVKLHAECGKNGRRVLIGTNSKHMAMVVP